MRGLEKVDMKRGHINRRTSRLLERIGRGADSLKIINSVLNFRRVTHFRLCMLETQVWCCCHYHCCRHRCWCCPHHHHHHHYCHSHLNIHPLIIIYIKNKSRSVMLIDSQNMISLMCLRIHRKISCLVIRY